MADDRNNDLPGADHEQRPADNEERFQLSRLAQMLDAPVEKVRQWLTDEDIHPVHPDYPEDYGLDAAEWVRMRQAEF